MKKVNVLIAVVCALTVFLAVVGNIAMAYVPVYTSANVTQQPTSSNGYTAKWVQYVDEGTSPFTVKVIFGDGSYANLTYQTARTYNWVHAFNGPFQTYYQTFSVNDSAGQKAYAYTNVVKRQLLVKLPSNCPHQVFST